MGPEEPRSMVFDLRSLTPAAFILQAWTHEPERFRLNPSHLFPGPCTLQASRFEGAMCAQSPGEHRALRGPRTMSPGFGLLTVNGAVSRVPKKPGPSSGSNRPSPIFT